MPFAARNRSRIPVAAQRPIQRPRIITRTRVVAPRQKPRASPRSNYFDLNKVFTDISSTFTRALSNPLVLCTIAIAIGVILTHDFEKKSGYIYDTFKDRNDNISQWIVNNGKKFAGLLIFAPAVVDSPRNLRAVVALVSFLWVMIIPESKAAEYFLQSLALHTYFRLSNNNSKLMVLLMVVIAWFLGFITVAPPQQPIKSSTTTEKLTTPVYVPPPTTQKVTTPVYVPPVTPASVPTTSTVPSATPRRQKPGPPPIPPYIDCGCLEPNQCGPPFGLPQNDSRMSGDYPRIYSPNCNWPRGKPQDTYIRPPDTRNRNQQQRSRNI